MKCQAAYVWLLAAKATTALPDEVQRHLGHCRRCQRCQRRLLRLDAELKRPPAGLAANDVKVRLFDRLASPPRQAPLSSPPSPRNRWRRALFLGAAAAVLLLAVGLGWFLGRVPTHTSTGASVVSSSPPPETPPAVDIVVRALRHDLTLAETFSPAAQARALGELASDLRREALRLARQGPMEELPLIANLHESVLRRGLLGRARVLPADRRPTEFAPLIQQLRDSAAEVLRSAEDSLPAVGDYLRAMSTAATETSRALLNPPKAMPAERRREQAGSEPRPLLEIVVLEGLELAEQEDPLRRADSCTTVAEQLVQTILLTSAMGQVQRASTLGQCLGELAERGVAANLNRVEPNDADGDRAAELDRVSRRAAAAEAALQSNWQRAPAPARKGLERAMDASRGGLEHAVQTGKGKSKPKDKQGHPRRERSNPPAGLERKREKASPERRDEKTEQNEENIRSPTERRQSGKPSRGNKGSR